MQESIAQQTLVNREWSTSDSSSYFFQKSVVKTDNNGFVYTLGSKMTGANGYDFLLLKQKANGDTVYIAGFDGDASMDDYATDLIVSPSGSVYISGASWRNSSDSLDPVIIKINSSGITEWYTYYSNSSGYSEFFSSLVETSAGDIIVGGGTNQGSGMDYLICLFDTLGNENSNNLFDYNGNNDILIKINYDAINSEISMAGAGQTDSTSWDYWVVTCYTTLIYKSEKGYNGGISTYRGVTDFKILNNTYYVTGYSYSSNTGYDIETIALDDSLNVLWSNKWNGADSLDDKSNAIGLDANGDVYITGYTTSNTRGQDMILQKLDGNTGSILWQRIFNGPDDSHDSGTDIEINGYSVYITGYTTSGGQVFSTGCYDTSGVLRWQKMSNTGVYSMEPDLALDVEGNPVIGVAVFGLLYVEKYTQLTESLYPVTDTTGLPLYEDNKLLVTFNPDKVDHSFIDNQDISFALIGDVIDSTLISTMENKLGVILRKHYIIKIVSQKTTDTISVSRHGYEVRIPKFWATLALQIPDTLDELTACDSLKTISDISNAELNVAFYLTGSNDPYFASGDGQSSLHPTGTYPYAHINIDTAWGLSVGKKYIKVGILDNGIWFTHSDFGVANNGSLSGSKIHGGYNYSLNTENIQNLVSYPGYYNHGTPVSGIIGALRNNGNGIAGIAGGDPDSSFIDSTGVGLYDMIICCGSGSNLSTGYINRLGQALYDGATSGPYSYNGLHIMNMSLGTSSDYATNFLRGRIIYARDNGVILVAARGNKSSLDSSLWYPAVYNDEWILNVGGSGTDGSYKKNGNGSGNGFLGMANQNLFTLVGKNIDFTAPQAYENTTSLLDNSSNSYTSFGGTSSSSAHVSGVAGLMLSYFNINSPSDQNLTIEDVEHILQYTAVDDTVDSAVVGYDIFSGYGKIDGGKALQVIQKPNYQVLHFTAWLNASDMVQVASNVQNTSGGFVINDYNAGNSINTSAYVNIYKISGVINHGNLISPSGQILGYWIRNSYTDAWDTTFNVGSSPQANAHKFADFEYFTQDSAKLYGYLYHSPGIQTWFPKNPNTDLIKLSYTVHVYDSTGQSSVEENPSLADIQLYPNPSKDFVNLQLTLPQSGKVRIRVLDMNGRLVVDYFNSIIAGGYHIMQVPVLSWLAGMYFLEIEMDNKTTVRKFIKTE